jgi:hypothetical protein
MPLGRRRLAQVVKQDLPGKSARATQLATTFGFLRSSRRRRDTAPRAIVATNGLCGLHQPTRVDL